ncbi:MAG TPA: thiol reductant ABC exporter subunit CydD [Acidimicrobiales bacterium]|nr:thiol reductant ABC exporter subunit CydD [Acidimicrobiales bacterium]
MSVKLSNTTAPAPGPKARTRPRPIDPRLLRYAHSTRRYLVLTVVLGGCTAFLVVAQAWLLATAVSGAFIDHKGVAQLKVPVALLFLAVLGRALVGWLSERLADRASARAKSELRQALVERVARLGPSGLDRQRSGGLTVLATSGIDALDAYFARYLPQVFLAVIVPVTVIVVALGADWISAVIIALTVPLIPLFMALVGQTTREKMGRQARHLQRLAGHFLDVVAGLPTLKVFGRAKAQAQAIADMTDQYRLATMDTLKVAFLSSLILELLATISVALVAVAVGLRLLGGHLGFSTALFVLILAPEAYLPLRLLGTNFHASAEGMKAADDVFGVLEQPLPDRGTGRDVPDLGRSVLRIEGLEVVYPGRQVPALRLPSLRVEPGEVVAVAGPSGCGKSTLLSVLLCLTTASAGSVHIGEMDLAELDPDLWRAHVSWVPQRPHLFARTIAENVRLSRPDASDGDVRAVIARVGLSPVVERLPQGLATVLGTGGAGLSTGERQRVALARAFLRDAPVLLLDEPTANLDGQTEEAVLTAVRTLMVGRTVIIAAHRPSLLNLADRVISLEPVGPGQP